VVRVRRGTIYIMELIADLLKGEGSDKRNVRRTKGPLYRRAQDKSGNSECRPSDPSPKGCEMSAGPGRRGRTKQARPWPKFGRTFLLYVWFRFTGDFDNRFTPRHTVCQSDRLQYELVCI
jgi:hypothetical protein